MSHPRVALESIEAEFCDVEPGEIVIFDKDGMRSIRDHCGKAKTTCIFEYIYFARPDSVIDFMGVHEARLRAGACLARFLRTPTSLSGAGFWH